MSLILWGDNRLEHVIFNCPETACDWLPAGMIVVNAEMLPERTAFQVSHRVELWVLWYKYEGHPKKESIEDIVAIRPSHRMRLLLCSDHSDYLVYRYPPGRREPAEAECDLYLVDRTFI